MEPEKKDNYREDEFDIELLFYKLYLLIGKIFSKVTYPVKLLFAKPIRLFIVISLAAIVSLILRYTLPPIYQASFIVKPLARGDAYFISLLNDLKTIIDDKDDITFAVQLNISEETASQVSDIDITQIKLNKYSDTIEAVSVLIKSKDFALFDTIQNHMITYLETNEYYLKRQNLRKVELNSFKNKLENDILEIDSLKKLLSKNIQPRGSQNGFVFGEPIDPVKIYEEGLNLYKQQQSLNYQLQYVNSFELVKKCVATHKPFFPRFTYLFAFFGVIAIIGLIVFNLKEQKRA